MFHNHGWISKLSIQLISNRPKNGNQRTEINKNTVLTQAFAQYNRAEVPFTLYYIACTLYHSACTLLYTFSSFTACQTRLVPPIHHF